MTTQELTAPEATAIAEIITPFDYGTLGVEDRVIVQQKTGEIHEHIDTMQRSVIAIGQRLRDIKARLGHGHWGAWLAVEFRWSDQTAANYMNAAQLTDQNPRFLEFEDQFAKSALTAFAAPSTPAPAREEAVQRAAAGETITHAKAQAIIDTHKPPARQQSRALPPAAPAATAVPPALPPTLPRAAAGAPEPGEIAAAAAPAPPPPPLPTRPGGLPPALPLARPGAAPSDRQALFQAIAEVALLEAATQRARQRLDQAAAGQPLPATTLGAEILADHTDKLLAAPDFRLRVGLIALSIKEEAAA